MSKQLKIFKNYSNPRKWFTANFADKDNPEILIYDMIGSTFWGDGMTPKDFVSQLDECKKISGKLNLRINSPGGAVHDGFTIYNAIVQSGLDVSVYIDGLAASAAAFIAMAGDKIYMPASSEIMIHDAWGIAMGNAEELRKEATHLESLTSMIADIFVNKTENKKEVIADLMKAETWMDGKKAVDLGFADELLEESQAAACLFELDDDLLPGLPDGFKKLQNALKKRAQENALRDAGLSRAEAARRASNTVHNNDEEIKTQASNLLKMEIQKCLK